MKRYILYVFIQKIGIYRIQEFFYCLIDYFCTPCILSTVFVLIYVLEIIIICKRKKRKPDFNESGYKH